MNLKTSKGFTIVELLIVIVVIAILAAISIVAYSGIQNRAKNSTAEQLASQVANKVAAYSTIKSTYPTHADLVSTSGPEEARLDNPAQVKSGEGAPSDEKTVNYKECTATGASAPTGGKVTYRKFPGGEALTKTVGTGC